MKTLICSFCLAAISLAQPPDTLWTRTYDLADQYEWVWDLKSIPDGGWIIAEATMDSLFQPYAHDLFRFDENGDILWSQTGLRPKGIIVLADGFLVAGDVLLRTDANGDSLWRRFYFNALGYKHIDTTANGDIYVSGQAGPSHFLVKADENGNFIWSYDITANVARMGGIVAMLDGGCVVAFMEAQTVPSHLGHPTIIRLDNDGNLMWTYVYPDSNLYGITNPLLTPNGDLACAFARNDAYFLRLSDTGDSLESRFVCHIGGSQSTRRLINANETGYTIVTDELLRITPNGQFLWSQAPQILVASDFVLYQDVVSLPDGGYLLAGNYVSEPTEVYWNTFILELDQERPLIIDTVLATAMNSGVQVMLSSLWEYQSQTIEFRRDTSPDGEFSVIASVPPNNEFEGSSYDIWDEDIIPGQTYWYLVTVSNLDGRTWEYREHMVSATALGTDDLPNVPREFALTAYPNPFNLSTTLSLSIPHAVEARVVLHDINGREAMVFAPRHFDAGIHTFAIDAARLASGVYFVSLTSETPLAIQKLLLLK